MRRLRTPLVVLVALCLVGVSVPAGQTPAPDLSGIDAVIRKELQETQTPGAAVAVVMGDRVVYTRGFGIANAETGEPVRPEMLFRLGSTTKMITAATVVLLAEQGKLSLTEPIGRHIPNLHPSLARLTAHQLLSHQSGILDEAPMFGSHDDTAMKSEIESWTDAKFFAEPGEVYSYSNPAYWLAGRLAEAVGGRPFADQVAETIFAPLGMTRSTFRPTMAMTYPLAQGHEVADGKARIIRPAADNSASWPAGSIYSNVMDLSRWMMAVVDRGQLGGAAVLPAGVYSSMTTPHAEIPGGAVRYGYGVQLSRWGAEHTVEHAGSRSGYGSNMRMIPARRFGVVVLGNRSGVSFPQTVEAATVAALGRRGLTDVVLRGAPLPSSELDALAGTYTQGGARRTVVVRTADGLALRQAGRDTALEFRGIQMSPDRPLERLFIAGATRYVFVTNPAGAVTFLHTGGRSWRKVQ
jgi:CubicO group peptidase (beta-lactamase class C family)